MRLLNIFSIKKYFKVSSKNSLSINSRLKNSRVTIYGFDNNLNIKQSNLKNIKINIEGDNNSLTVDENCHIRNLSIIMLGNNLNLHIGKNCKIGEAQIVCAGEKSEVVIGDDVLMAHNIEIRNNDGHSIFDKNGTLLNPSKNIYIKNRVWLAQACKILKGATISEDSVIAMNSLVSKGLYPSNIILAGVPAKIVKNEIYWKENLPL